MGFLTSMFSGPKAAQQPPPPPPAPPAAIAPTYADNTQSQQAAKQRMSAAAGAGFDGTLSTSPQGAAPAQTALKTLTGA